jgi:hypothetical protein
LVRGKEKKTEAGRWATSAHHKNGDTTAPVAWRGTLFCGMLMVASIRLTGCTTGVLSLSANDGVWERKGNMTNILPKALMTCTFFARTALIWVPPPETFFWVALPLKMSTSWAPREGVPSSCHGHGSGNGTAVVGGTPGVQHKERACRVCVRRRRPRPTNRWRRSARRWAPAETHRTPSRARRALLLMRGQSARRRCASWSAMTSARACFPGAGGWRTSRARARGGGGRRTCSPCSARSSCARASPSA